MSSTEPKTMSGSCACGASTFVSTEPGKHLDYCYCMQCQQISGAPFMAWSGVPRAALTYSGPIEYFQLSDVATRGFCQKCGGPMSLQYKCYLDKTHIPMAMVLRSDFEMPKITVHLFVKSKPSWHQIPDDGVPRYDEFDEEFSTLFPDVVKRLKGNGEKKTA